MEPETKQNGAFVGLVIIVLIILVGGIYIWQAKVKNALEEKKRLTQPVTESSDPNALDNLDKDLQNADVNTNVDVKTLK